MVQYRNAKDMDIGPTFITRYWHNIIFTLANIGQYYSDISHWEYIVPILVEYQRATWEGGPKILKLGHVPQATPNFGPICCPGARTAHGLCAYQI